MYKKVLIIMLSVFAFEGFGSTSGGSSGSGGSSSGAGPSAAGAGGPPASVPLVGADTSCFPYCVGRSTPARAPAAGAAMTAQERPVVMVNPIGSAAGGASGGAAAAGAGGSSGRGFGSATAGAGAGADGHRDGAELLMGIEVETSAIKVNSKYHDGFWIGQPPFEWVLEFDTSDRAFMRDPHLRAFERNLECRTMKGHGAANIITMANYIQTALEKIYAGPDRTILIFDPAFLLKTLGVTKVEIINGEAASLQPVGASRSFQVLLNSADNKIKVQITYQLPFEKIEAVFQHIAPDYAIISDFLSALNPSSAVPDISSSDEPEDPILVIQDQIQIFFIQKVAPVFVTIESPKLKGFCYLFLYYWFALFNEKKKRKDTPGLKDSLAIMSRIPLSQMYDALSSAEQEWFETKIGPIVEKEGRAYKLRPYNDEYSIPSITNTLSIKGWYYSITKVSERVSRARLDAFKFRSLEPRQVDLLSPPKGLIKDSMGLYDINDSQGFALIEVRAYAVRPHEKKLIINNLTDFVRQEAGWFFGI